MLRPVCRLGSSAGVVACWLGSLGSAIGFGWGGGSGICGRPGQVRPALLPPAVRLSLDWRPSGNAAPVLAVYPPAAPHTRSAVWPVVRAGPATPRSGVSVFLCFSRRVSRSLILYLDGVTRAPYCYVLTGGRPQMKPARHRPSTGQEERRPRTTSVHGPVHRSPCVRVGTDRPPHSPPTATDKQGTTP